MPLRPWKTLRTQFEIRNPWWTYRKDLTLLPSGAAGEYHYVHVKGSSMIVPLRGDGKMILVNQYRYLGARESLEFPCGSVKEDATYEETARLELAEETGMAAGSLEPLGAFCPYNGVTDEICRIYLARNLTPAANGGHRDETEEFEYIHLSPQEFEQRIRAGAIWDGMTLSAWSLIRHVLMP
jgi:ADP-ribose pyrophosphatase